MRKGLRPSLALLALFPVGQAIAFPIAARPPIADFFMDCGVIQAPAPVQTPSMKVIPKASPKPTPPPPEPAAPISRSSEPEFIFPDSDRRIISPDELLGMDSETIRLARNEIYARKGRFMKDDQLRAYFSQFSWYQPFTWDVSLNAVEKANIATFQKAEQP